MITNYFSPLEFQVNVARMPNVEFFVQKTTIPSVQGNPVEVPTPFNRTFHTPDKLQYSPLVMSFIIDENMMNYMEVLKWIKGTTFPERYGQYKDQYDSEHGIYSDITIVVLNSSKNPSIKITYRNCQPTSLSEVMLDTTSRDVVYPEASVVFTYDYFDITPYFD